MSLPPENPSWKACRGKCLQKGKLGCASWIFKSTSGTRGGKENKEEGREGWGPPLQENEGWPDGWRWGGVLRSPPPRSQPTSGRKSCPSPASSGLHGTSALGEQHTGLTQSFKNISPPTEHLINQASSHPCVTAVAVICRMVT